MSLNHDESSLKRMLKRLSRKHQKIEKGLDALNCSGSDELFAHRLKKEKLRIKDQMQTLKAMLKEDITA